MNRTGFLILIVLGSCTKKAGVEKDMNADKDSLVQKIETVHTQEAEDTASVPFSQSLKGNGYTYILKGLESPNGAISFKSVSIFYKKKLYQKITVDTVSVLRDSEVVFNIDKDVNFDGSNDIELINWAGNYAWSSSFWLYNKKSKKICSL